MQIVSGISTLQEAELLVLTGATALVFEVKGNCWQLPVPEGMTPIHGGSGITTSSGQLRKIVDCAHSNGAAIFISLDEQPYSDKDIPQVIHMTKRICSTNRIDGILTSNPGLVLAIREERIYNDVLLGPSAFVLNRQAIMFWNELKVTRIFLPPYLDTAETEDLVSGMKGNEFYVTVFRGHSRDKASSTNARRLRPGDSIDVLFCSLCNIPNFKSAGVHGVFVDIGGESCHEKIGLVTVIRTLLDMLVQGASEEEMRMTAKEEIECGELSRCGYICMFDNPIRTTREPSFHSVPQEPHTVHYDNEGGTHIRPDSHPERGKSG